MIREVIRREYLTLCAAFLFGAGAAGQIIDANPKMTSRSPDVRQILSWLPVDTETVIAAKDFLLPDVEKFRKEHNPYTEEIELQSLPLATWALKNGSLAEYFKNQKVLLAVEGARHFRSPESLGTMPFEGCTFIMLADDQSDRIDSFANTASGNALRIEDVEGQKVLVFEERSESDLWTTFVVLKKPNILLVATNLDYLRKVLERMRGKNGPRALPETLLEWKYVNTDAQYWGLRHYDHVQGKTDPSSPFFRGTKSMGARWFDNQAIGLTFSYDPATGKAPTITYVSGNPSIARAERGPLSYEGNKLGIVYRDLDTMAVEATYDVRGSPAAATFSFFLSFILGHGVFV